MNEGRKERRKEGRKGGEEGREEGRKEGNVLVNHALNTIRLNFLKSVIGLFSKEENVFIQHNLIDSAKILKITFLKSVIDYILFTVTWHRTYGKESLK